MAGLALTLMTGPGDRGSIHHRGQRVNLSCLFLTLYTYSRPIINGQANIIHLDGRKGNA